MQVILSDGDLSTLANMKLNLSLNCLSLDDDHEPGPLESSSSVSITPLSYFLFVRHINISERNLVLRLIHYCHSHYHKCSPLGWKHLRIIKSNDISGTMHTPALGICSRNRAPCHEPRYHVCKRQPICALPFCWSYFLHLLAGAVFCSNVSCSTA